MTGWRRKRNLKFYQQQMLSFDLQQYFKTNEFPADMPEDLKLYTQKIISECYNREAELLAKQQSRYSALQSQINPHFLYNTLESIRSEALIHHNTSVAKMTETLSRFFRYCISNQSDFITLRDEILNLNDYFYIQKYRFGERFSLDIQIDDDKALENYMPKMVLQPLVENAIFHGLENKKNGGRITIHSALTSNALYLWVSDNGIGMNAEQLKELHDRLLHPETSRLTAQKHKGIAMTNINTRIQLQFGAEYGLRISSIEQKGTDIEIRLPRIDNLNFKNDFRKDEKA